MAWRKKSGLRSGGTVQSTLQRHEANLYEALDYLDRVKLRYTEQPEVFVYFLELLGAHSGGRIDYFGLIRGVSTLFADSLDLIEAFNPFMPAGYHIECGAADKCLIVRITIPDGTSIDTKIHLGTQASGNIFSQRNGDISMGPGMSPSSSASMETQIRLNVPESSEPETSRLQMLASLATRPSIAETARDAVRAKRDATLFASQTNTRAEVPPFRPNGETRPSITPGSSFRFIPPPGHRVEFASQPHRPLNHASGDRIMDDTTGSGSSRESPNSSRKDASPKRKLSNISMPDASPVQDNSRPRSYFQSFPSFSELKRPDAGFKPQVHPNQYTARKQAENSMMTNNMPWKGTIMKSDEFKPSELKPGQQQEDGKPAKKPRSTKRVHSGQPKSARTHTNRAFPCPFATYGCPATFGSKNEWKRHINTQHMRLGYWRCDLCDQVRPNDFNRKDLFIQHMRRMHSSDNKSKSDSKPAAKNDPEEQALTAAANRCWRHIHSPPEQSSCLFCEVKFNGVGTWDERLEHIGRHMELIVKEGETVDSSKWEKDLALEEWLVREEILVEGKEGGYTLAESKM